MPSLAELREKLKESQEESKKTSESQEKKIISGEKIPITKPKTRPKKIQTCPECNKKNKLSGDKDMNRQELIQWFQDFVSENEKNLPLDWLRGQKLSFESVNEMRK